MRNVNAPVKNWFERFFTLCRTWGQWLLGCIVGRLLHGGRWRLLSVPLLGWRGTLRVHGLLGGVRQGAPDRCSLACKALGFARPPYGLGFLGPSTWRRRAVDLVQGSLRVLQELHLLKGARKTKRELLRCTQCVSCSFPFVAKARARYLKRCTCYLPDLL